MHDPTAELKTLRDELAVIQRRMKHSGPEAMEELRRQQAMIKRDIRRNSAILEDRSSNCVHQDA